MTIDSDSGVELHILLLYIYHLSVQAVAYMLYDFCGIRNSMPNF